jgi:hypothetical protein
VRGVINLEKSTESRRPEARKTRTAGMQAVRRFLRPGQRKSEGKVKSVGQSLP